MSHDKRSSLQCGESIGKHDESAASHEEEEKHRSGSRHPDERHVETKQTSSPPEKTTTTSARHLSTSHSSLILLPIFDEGKSVSTPALSFGHTQSLLLYPTSSENQLEMFAHTANGIDAAEAENKNLLGNKKLTYYESTHRHVRRPKLRRAVSLSSSFPEARIGRTRKLYCPRQPPTNLQRTLSISRTNIPIFKKATGKRLTSKQKLVLFCISLVSFFSFLSMAIIAPFFPVRKRLEQAKINQIVL